MRESRSSTHPLIAIGAVALAVAGLIYVNGLRAQVDELEETQREHQAAVNALRDTFSELEHAAREVASEMDRFESENWRDVVPDMQTATEQLANAVREVEAGVERLDR